MKIKSLLLMVYVVSVVSGLSGAPRIPNPTTSHLPDKFKFVSADLTDTDGDGMTDVGELKYGFDPNDSESFPTEQYYLDENSTFKEPVEQEIFSENNRFYYKFTKTSKELELQYREFFATLMPLLYHNLGPPMETIVCEFKCVGATNTWYSTNAGRKILFGNRLSHRVMIHEIIHSWKGKHLLASDDNGRTYTRWKYQPDLSGFEEGLAEGMAYEIVKEWVRTYPSHPDAEKLLWGGSWRTSGKYATEYDVTKHMPATGGGYPFSGEQVMYEHRYSIGATTSQIMIAQRPTFYRDLMEQFANNIKRHEKYRPTRLGLINEFRLKVSNFNGLSAKKYLKTLPVYQGHDLVDGFYPLYSSTHRGTQLVPGYGFSYAVDGSMWWGSVTDDNKHEIPDWVPSAKLKQPDYEMFYAIETREQPFQVDVYNVHNEVVSSHQLTTPNGGNSYGDAGRIYMSKPHELRSDKFPIGLYRNRVQWTNFIQHTDAATYDVHFFGKLGYTQDKREENAILVGVDADIEGLVQILVNGVYYTKPLVNGCAIFKSRDWPLDLEEIVSIYVRAGGVEHRYERTVLDSVPGGYHLSEFVIIDRDFDGIEDPYDDEIGIPVKHEGDYVAVTYEKTSKGLNIRWEDNADDNVSLSLNLVSGVDVLYRGGSYRGYADIDYEKFGLSGTEILDMWFTEYHGRKFAKKYNAVRVNLNEFSENPMDLDLVVATPGVPLNELPSIAGFDIRYGLEHGFVPCGCKKSHKGAPAPGSPTQNVLIVEPPYETLELHTTASSEPIKLDLDGSVIGETLETEKLPHETVSIHDVEFDTSTDSSNEKVLSLISHGETNLILTESTNVAVAIDTSVYENAETLAIHNDRVSNIVISESEMGSLERIKSVYESTNETAPDHYPNTGTSPVVEDPVVEEPVVDEWESADVYDGGWRHNEWFGYYFESTETDWMFKPCGGWFYRASKSYDSVWLFSSTLNGWIWTSQDAYPYIYSTTTGWMYLNEDKHCIYDFTLEQWISLEDVN